MSVLKGYGTIDELYERLRNVAKEMGCNAEIFGPDYECLNNKYEEACLFELINECKAWIEWRRMEEMI